MQPTSRSAQSVLIDWANEQQNWVRRIVGEILSTRGPLSGDELTRAYALSLAERGLSDDGNSGKRDPRSLQEGMPRG